MSYTTTLGEIIGHEAAAVLVRQIAAALEYHDQLPADTAFKVACQRASDGDPHFIAAPGQTWVVRPDAAAYVSVTEYAVRRRTPYHTCAIVVPVDGPNAGIESEVELSDLAAYYQLATWLPIDPDLAREPLA